MDHAQVVICGAGIAGVATAYHLAVRYGVGEVVLVDERAPMSLTSDKSTECYRNWWPGPGDAMVGMMNRSIDLLEEWAEESGNLFHLNRRGYLYTTCDPERVADLEGFAQEASSLGAGPVRVHGGNGGETYVPASRSGFTDQPDGADLITEGDIIREHYPYLSEEIVAALHVRRAGWLSAQQYGAYLLERAKACGVQLVEDRVVGVEVEDNRVQAVVLGGGERIHTAKFVNAAGPMLAQVGEMLGVEIPVCQELHLKVSFNDPEGVIGREAPLLIDIDQQTLPWNEEERAMLEEDEKTRPLTGRLPSGAHARPEGGSGAATVIGLWDLHTDPVEPTFPPPLDPMIPELVLRGLIKMIPGLQAYLERMPKPYLDGGYYTKTRENRPLAGPLAVEGGYVIGALSGYGIMASAGLGELVAAHVAGLELPDYASAFDLYRYDDPDYRRMLSNWGDTWQL